jgi:hypothetical protein
MASTLKNAAAKAVGITAASVVTAAAGKTIVLLGVNIANINSQVVSVDIIHVIGGVDHYILKGVNISPGGAFTPSGNEQKIILMAGDTLKVKSDIAASLDVVASYAEIG